MSATYKKHPEPARLGRARRAACVQPAMGRGESSCVPDAHGAPRPTWAGSQVRWRAWFGVWCLVLGVLTLRAADPSIPDLPKVTAGEHSNRVHQAYVDWAGRFTRDQTNSETAWRFAKACFERADFSTNDAQRAALAEQGIAASKRAVALETNSAAGYFYLGVNLGQMARTKLFSALGLLDEMEAAWERSIAIDPQFHHAAATRSLGLLYLDAPGWPLSLGSRGKARRELQRAVELVPGYPENQLCWLETRLRWGEKRAVQTQLPAVELVLQSARTNFTGETWTLDWADWDVRWHRIKLRADAVPVARSPKDSLK